jgi:hypothetical protein
MVRTSNSKQKLPKGNVEGLGCATNGLGSLSVILAKDARIIRGNMGATMTPDDTIATT